MLSNVVGIGNKEPKQPKLRNKGFFRGSYAGSLAAVPVSVGSMGIAKLMQKMSCLPQEDAVTISQAAQKGLEQSGLKDKGVEILKIKENKILTKGYIKDLSKKFFGFYRNLFKGNIDEESMQTLIDKAKKTIEFDEADKPALDAIKEAQKKTSEKMMKKLGKIMRTSTQESTGVDALSNELTEKMRDITSKTVAIPFREGKNAAFIMEANKIIVPEKALATSVFHEMGHALNRNGGAILRALQNMRGAGAAVSSLVLLISLLNKRKKTDEKLDNSTLKNKVQNGADFVKRNAGKITALGFAPMVIEEGIASIRGQGIAKQLVKDGKLSQALYKKVVATNACGFATYLLAMVAAGVSAKIAVDVKDKIQEKYEAKQMDKYQKKLDKYNANKS